MKNFIFTVSLIFILGILSVQQASSQSSNFMAPGVEIMNQQKLQKMADIEKSNFISKVKDTKSVKSRWYNAAFAYKTLFQSTISVGSLFPDSTILLNYASGLFPASIHSVAVTVDPRDDIYTENNMLKINEYMPYTVDSIGIYAIYTRKTVSTVVDTLLIQIRLTGANYRFYASSSSSWVQSVYLTDTLAFRSITHDKFKPYSTDANVITIKYPLTASSINDTTDAGWNYFKVAPPSTFTVPAGQQFVVNYSFIPGYTWNANTDTLSEKNRFRFVSYEEGGVNTFPTYTKWNWTSSSILGTKDLYKDANAAQLLYAPNYLFLKSYAYEHHWAEYKLTSNETSIGDNLSSEKNYILGQNYPNPCTDNISINYYLSNSATSVTLDIYNVVGKKEISLIEKNTAKGNHKININVSKLNAGIYFYTLCVDGITTTRKMIVN